MAQQRHLLFSAVLCAFAVAVSARCGGEMPNQPNPGHSHSITITVADPNLGEVQ